MKRNIGYREEFEFQDSDQCPQCGSNDIEVVGGEMAFADGEDVDHMECNHCHLHWKERSDGFIVYEEEKSK